MSRTLLRRPSRLTTCLFAVPAFVLLSVAPLRAQSILDAQRVQFLPSTDNNALAADGTPLVQNYTLTVYPAGASTIFASANLGKPTPDPDGYMRVDFSTLLSVPLQVGSIYEAVVSAVGPGGSSDSVRSNTFELTTTCTAALSASSQNVGPGSTSGAVGVTATCGWIALSGASWITVTSGASTTGNGTVGFSVAANTVTSARSGALTIAGNTFTVNQAALSCTYALSTTSQAAAAGGSGGSVGVSAPAGCAWTSASNASWLTVTSGASGSGAGTVGFSAAPNTSGASRTGTLTIGGVTFTVTQSACAYAVSPTSLTLASTATTGSLSLSTTAGCTWTGSSSASWITVPTGGTGTATIAYSASADTVGPSRTATLTIAGRQVSVTQSGTAPKAPTNVHIIK